MPFKVRTLRALSGRIAAGGFTVCNSFGHAINGESIMGQFMRAVLWVALALPQFAGATAGGVDAAGCHQSKKDGYHCHQERAKGSAGGGAGAESQTARDKRMARECKGKANGGACLGYGSF